MSRPILSSHLARAFFALFLGFQLSLAPLAAAHAQNRGVPIVRDAEIEALVADYVRPILKAAGLASSGIQTILVNDDSFNAFVAGRRIFINTGALMDARTPNEIIGVIAHEAGHIAGGHQQNLRDRMQRAQTLAVVGALLGIGVGIAGASSDSGGLAQAGTGLALAGPHIARRGFLSYQRAEEVEADRSALTYLRRTGQSAKGMLDTFKRLQSALSLAGVNVDPYEISHPLPRDRLANLTALAHESPYYERKDPAALQLRHDMMRAKIAAYTEGPAKVARLFRNDPRGLPARYGDAISTYLHGNPQAAIGKIDRLIAEQPKNPYFQELRGDALIKANRPREAAQAYARAIQLDRNHSGLLQVGYGRALLATGDKALIRKAAVELQQGLAREPEYASGYRFLAQAEGRLGNVAEAELATAEGHFQSGNYRDAKIFAARAQRNLKRGAPAWLRAQDIIDFRGGGR